MAWWVRPWKHLSVDHHVQSPPRSLFVGECYTHVINIHMFGNTESEQPKSRFLQSQYFTNISFDADFVTACSVQHLYHTFEQYSKYVLKCCFNLKKLTLSLPNAIFQRSEKNGFVFEWHPFICEFVLWDLKGVISQMTAEPFFYDFVFQKM